MKTEKQIWKKVREVDKKLDGVVRKMDKILTSRVKTRKVRDSLEERYENLEDDLKFYADFKSGLMWTLSNK